MLHALDEAMVYRYGRPDVDLSFYRVYNRGIAEDVASLAR
jgi:hypothetical protein